MRESESAKSGGTIIPEEVIPKKICHETQDGATSNRQVEKKRTTTDKSGESKKGTEKDLTGFILLASEGEIGLGFFFYQSLANDPKIMKEEND